MRRFNIKEDFKQQYNENNDADTIERYANEIMQHKTQKNVNLHNNDAKNMLWIELARKGCDYNVRDTKFYFVTSDRKLQEWDLTHSKNQPITMLPSQWLALLLKYFSRSNDDFKSFVSFLTMPHDKGQVSPDELQDILAGISEITEEFQKQEDIVSNLLELEDNKKYRDREGAKRFAKEKLESEYEEKLINLKSENQQHLEEQKQALAQETEDRIERMLKEFQEERRRERIERVDEKITSCKTQLEDKMKLSEYIKSNCNSKKNWLIGIVITFLALYIIGMIVFIFVVYNWEKMEPVTYISGLIIIAFALVVSLISNKSFEFWKIPYLYQNWHYKKQCIKYNYNEAEIVDLQETIDTLKRQKTELETKI